MKEYSLKDLEKKANEILELVNELKQRAAENFELIEISALIDQAIEKANESDEFRDVQGKIEINRQIDKGLPRVKADEILREVFINFLTNAAKEMPNGGLIEINASSDGESVLVSFKDKGRGIPPEMHHMIFDTQFSTDEKPGHGIGLWWSRAYVRALGGEILLDSDRGRGACFTVKMPIPHEEK